MNNFSQSWKNLPWKKFQKRVFNIQKRIYKAVQAGNIRRAKQLQKLLIRSRAARFIATRQIIQLNNGRKTAGIDGLTQKHYHFEKRLKLVETINQKRWEHSNVRQIKIPKKNGEYRRLGIPTIQDRVWQCLIKMALEPAHEATFHERSYGFRPGRSTHDCQKMIFNNLNSGNRGDEKRILSLDIKSCFDKISHSSILKRVICPHYVKENLHRCLNKGSYVEFPEMGTPQGGPISPLLANIALNGIESIHRCVRYADDMVIILKPRDKAEKILTQIEKFLWERGLEVNKAKTKLYDTEDGFDYLGWHFIVQKNGKFRCNPSQESYKNIKRKIKKVVNCSNYGSKVKAKKIAPIVRGWKNYHRYCKMDKYSLFLTQKRTWNVFNKEANNNRYKVNQLIKKAFPSVSYSTNKHINVKGNKSPYDGDIVYWSKRNSNKYDNHTARTLKRQNHKCGQCRLHFITKENVHLHHIDGNHNNWKRDNLLAVHESCHDYIHMSK